MAFPLHFVDVETSHLDHDIGELLSLAIITEEDGLITHYSTLISPVQLHRADPKSLQINGYTSEKWAGAPTFEQIAPQVRKKLRYGLIVGHHVSFDVGYINAALSRAGEKRISYHHFCTRMLMREHLYFLRRTSMQSAREFFGWADGAAHQAEADAMDCRRL